jgi:hypothetical protein
VRRVSAGKHILFADIEDVCVEADHRPNLTGFDREARHSRIGSSKVAPLPRKRATEAGPNPTAGVSFSTRVARRISRASASMLRLARACVTGLGFEVQWNGKPV